MPKIAGCRMLDDHTVIEFMGADRLFKLTTADIAEPAPTPDQCLLLITVGHDLSTGKVEVFRR